MQDAASGNHAAAAWLEGRMDVSQRQEFETHLAGCAECQAEVAALRAALTQRQAVLLMPIPAEPESKSKSRSRSTRRGVLLVIGAIVILIVGFALGWSVWLMTDH
jgi:anti-sigma factor RsiW